MSQKEQGEDRGWPRIGKKDEEMSEMRTDYDERAGKKRSQMAGHMALYLRSR